MPRRIMHKSVGLFLLCHFWISSFSQDSLYFENLTCKEKYVLIVGIENVLKFDPSIDNILFNAEHVLKKGSIFKIKPNQVGSSSVMLFSGTSMKGSIDFEAKYYKQDLQKNLDPKVKLGSLPGGGKVTAYELLSNSALRIYTGNSIGSSYEILSFNAIRLPKNGDVADDVEHNSAELNKTILDYIKQSKSGDVLLIENVKVRSPDGSLRRIEGLSYQIK
jgi:hypothetical protein